MIIDSATRNIGKYRRKKQLWITNDILDLCDERRSLKAAKNKNNIELISKYRKESLNRVPNSTNSKKGNLRKCENYRTLSLICHSSNILLRSILNRLTSQAEEGLSEEQAGFRKGRSTTEQIFNFIDFKKLLIGFGMRDSVQLSINMASTLI